MKIITAYPVIKNGKVISDNFTINTMNYASAEGDKMNFQQLLQKGKDLIGSGKVKSVIDTVKGLGIGKNRNKSMPPASMPPPPPPPTGLSKGAKIGIAIGGVAVLGLVIYLATRKK
jgi:hypothetical protein